MCRLMEIESQLLPCGLHVVGSSPTAMEATATLVHIAETDRPEKHMPQTLKQPLLLDMTCNHVQADGD